MQESGIYKTPCPNCSGQVEHYFFGGDCRGNPPFRSIYCKGCRREFTVAEWNLIAREEMREREREQQVQNLAWNAKQIGQTLSDSPQIVKKLEQALFSGKNPAELNDKLSRFHQQLLDYAKAYERLCSIT